MDIRSNMDIMDIRSYFRKIYGYYGHKGIDKRKLCIERESNPYVQGIRSRHPLKPAS